jgi:hypothetical protein
VIFKVFIRVFYVVKDTMCEFYGGRGLNWFGHVCGFNSQG